MLALAEAVAAAGRAHRRPRRRHARRRDRGGRLPRYPHARAPACRSRSRCGSRRRAAPAGPSPHARWRAIDADRAAGLVRRPPGTAIDSGGLAKGLFADLLAARARRPSGLRRELRRRPARSAARTAAGARREPVRRAILHTFRLTDGGVATSGITARSWLDASGAPAHHLLDPATGPPAFTGVVQATALAPTALEAELRAKAALLSGPDGARGWLLPHGGVVVHDDASHEVIAGTATA